MARLCGWLEEKYGLLDVREALSYNMHPSYYLLSLTLPQIVSKGHAAREFVVL